MSATAQGGRTAIAENPNAGLEPEWFDWKAPDYDRVWRERMASITDLRAEPSKWETLREFYKEHPAEFINDWGVTFDPRNAGTSSPTTLPFLLFARQVEFVRWLQERYQKREDGVVEKSRDMGVSWLCCGFAAWLWCFWPGSASGFGSRKEEYVDKIGDPKSLFWKLRSFIDLLPVELQPRGYRADKHAPYMRILNPENEATIVGEAGDNMGRGGRTSIYFKDESSHYEHPEAIDAALSQNTNVQIDVATPNGEGNPFWAKVHGGKIAKFVFDWRQDPRKDKAWYATQVGRMTKVALAAEVDRDYSASVTNSFIDSSRVTLAMARGPKDVRAIGPLRVGLDVARYGDDSNVLTFRRGKVLLRQVKWSKCDLESTAGRARQEILAFQEQPEQIAIDVIGLGAGVADMMRNFPGWREIVVDVNSSLRLSDGKNYNLRALMWQQMKDWLGWASIPNSQELRVALTGLRYKFKGGEMLIEAKEDAKLRGLASPDEADSLALTFAFLTGTRKPPPIDHSRVAVTVPDPETGM